MFRHCFPIFLFFILAFFGAVGATLAGRVPLNIADNHFLLDLPYGDKGTVYLVSDHSMLLLPSYTNKSYTHICHGRWHYDEGKQTMKISEAKKCTFMNGTYRVSRQRDSLFLKNSRQTLVFRMF